MVFIHSYWEGRLFTIENLLFWINLFFTKVYHHSWEYVKTVIKLSDVLVHLHWILCCKSMYLSPFLFPFLLPLFFPLFLLYFIFLLQCLIPHLFFYILLQIQHFSPLLYLATHLDPLCIPSYSWTCNLPASEYPGLVLKVVLAHLI